MIPHIHGLPFAASQSSALPAGFGDPSGASFAGAMAEALFGQESEGLAGAEGVLGVKGLTLVLSESTALDATKSLSGEAREAQSADARPASETGMPVPAAASLPAGWLAGNIEPGVRDASALALGESNGVDVAEGRAASPGRDRLAAWPVALVGASPADASEPMVGMPEASRRLSTLLGSGGAMDAAEKRATRVDVTTESAGEPADEPATAAAEGKKLPPAQAMFAALARQGAEDTTRTGRVPSNESTSPESKPALAVTASSMPSPVLSTSSSAMLTTESSLAAGATGSGATPAPTTGVESALAATSARPTVAGETARVVMQVPAQFESPGWSQALGDKLVWMAGRQTQSAELILNPPSLGAVEVRLNVSGGEASAQFFSANPAVREALESALPRLRELMGGVGIALGQASVSDQSQSQRDRAALSGQSGHAQDGGTSGRLDLEVRPGDVRRVGLLDYFA